MTAPLLTTSQTDEATVVLDRWRTELALTVRGVSEGPVARILHDEVMRMETSISRFRPDSELSLANRQAGRWTDVTSYFADVLQASLEAAEATDGLVDPCLADLVDAAGYRAWRSGGTVAAPRPARMHADSTWSWRDVEIRPAGSHRQVRVPPGLALDLGAVAKGWLADRVALRAVADLGADAVADMGGDLRAIAREEPWTVIADPEQPHIGITEFVLWDGALATSGVGRRAWSTADGAPAHHIIDPRTGHPADSPWQTCSVLARSAAAANTVATAGIVLGVDGPDWVARRGLDAWFVSAHDAVEVGSWPR
jgi:thiamine biosynthesis lipoprotein